MGRSRVIIGLGTGHCGTRSLASILDACESVACRHQFRHCEKVYEPRNFYQFVEERPEDFVGDISFDWIAHMEEIYDRYPDAAVICVKRDREKTVETFLRHNEERKFLQHEEWPIPFPVPMGEPRERVEAYYDWYYGKVRRWTNVFWIRCEDLTDKAAVKEMFNYVGIPEEDQRFTNKNWVGKGY